MFGQHAGYARFRYNRALGEFRAGLDAGAWLAHRSLRSRWNRVKGVIAPWSAEMSQNAANREVRHHRLWSGGHQPEATTPASGRLVNPRGGGWDFPGTSGESTNRGFGSTTVPTRWEWTAGP